MVDMTLMFTFYQRILSRLNQRDFQPKMDITSTKVQIEVNVDATFFGCISEKYVNESDMSA